MLDFRIKDCFFDRAAVVNALDKARAAVLSKFGAYVRQTARKSLVRRKASAPPGSPPSSHKGTLRRFIYFGYDTSTGSVVIGPVPMGAKGGTDALSALEHGGPTVVKFKGKKGVRRRVVIAPRPFMVPAFDAEIAKLPELFLDSVKP